MTDRLADQGTPPYSRIGKPVSDQRIALSTGGEEGQQARPDFSAGSALDLPLAAEYVENSSE